MFEFPKHFTYPEDARVWFKDHIQNWEHHLAGLFDGYQLGLVKKTHFEKGDLTENYYAV